MPKNLIIAIIYEYLPKCIYVMYAGVNILHFIGKLFPVKIDMFGLTFPYLLTKSVKMTNFSPLINGE